MKVLFLSPPQNDKMLPSLGLAYVAAMLNKHGHEAVINDGVGVSQEEMLKFG
jgi:hypothetical protein